MPPEPSVTSASREPLLGTFRYPSALLPKSFERPGPKSVSPAMNCSGVAVVVCLKWIVAMRTPFSSRATSSDCLVARTHGGSDDRLYRRAGACASGLVSEQFLDGDWQRADPRARRVIDRIGDRGCHPGDGELPDTLCSER